EAVVVAVGIGTHSVDAVVVRVDQVRAGVDRNGEGTEYVRVSCRGVPNLIRVGSGGRGKVRVVGGLDVETAASDVRHRDAGVLFNLVLDGKLGLFGVRVLVVLGVELDGRGIRLASRQSCQGSGEDGACSELRGDCGREVVTGLIGTVALCQ